jgi:16S rRNA (cytidine1402-2'-O)-methyltransferase
VAGPSAVAAALSVSGLPAVPFTFHGYAPRSAGDLKEWIERWTSRHETSVFFESPSRIAKTLAVLAQTAPDCRITVCRELTKIHEQVVQTTASEALAQIARGDIQAKGEFVLVARPEQRPSFVDPVALIAELLDEGANPNQAARAAANLTGLPKSDLYRLALDRLKVTRSGTPASDDA